jgi:hypothetical protein
MLPTFKGIINFWSELISNWHNKYLEICEEKTENIKQRIKNLIPWITGSTALSLNHNNIIFNE